MVNKIFAKNIKSPESNDLSDHFVRLESAYSNTISDVAAVFTHILHQGRKMARSSGHRTPALNPG